jgi:tripartite-type tricarboxylate transporter receptor subunit TctC
VGSGGVTDDQALFWQGALQQVFETPAFKDYMEKNSLRPLPNFGPAALQYIERENEQLTQALRDLGLVKP